jgi:bacteriorhodopsin
MLDGLSLGQYSLVFNMLSFTIATMMAAFAFFIMVQPRLAPQYRISMIVSALVVGIAAYHYFRIADSWSHAFTLTTGKYLPSGIAFNDAYRYVDWMLTVPLLLVELILVLNLTRERSGGLIANLSIAAFLMIVTGYPGEVADNNTTRAIWGFISTIPFVYIVYVLWVELGKVMESQPAEVRVLFRNMRLLILATWGFYPIVYMLPFIGFIGPNVTIGIQIGYTIADILAKAGYGVLIYAVASIKSENDGWSVERASAAA